tara:strand:+ start:954 stop:1106 length:153 start_codon:yes stop_codon:yes gene_type:complete
MTKIIEKNTAELIVVLILTVVLLSSCSTNYTLCDAYATNETKSEQYEKNN